MTTTINTLAVSSDGVIRNIKVSVTVSYGLGIHVVNMADKGIKELLLRVITALQSAGYRIPQKKIVIQFSEEVNEMFSLSDSAVATALLIASGQLVPAMKHEVLCLAGELQLNGNIRTPAGLCRHDEGCPDEDGTTGICNGGCRTFENIRYEIVDWQMYHVPEAMDIAIMMNTDSASLSVNSLNEIADILKNVHNEN